MNHTDVQAAAPGSLAAQTTALPGFALFFLVGLYAWLPGFLLAQIGLTHVAREENLEALFWSFAAAAGVVGCVICMVGLHTRAAWAREACRVFCLGLGIMQVAVLLRFLVLLGGTGHSRHYDMEALLPLSLPGLLLAGLPLLCAWHGYFTHSPRLAAAFGQYADGRRGLPAGPALCKVLAWIYICHLAGLFLGMLCSGVFLSDGSPTLIFLAQLPMVAFAAAVIVAAGRPTPRKGVLLACLAAWLGFCALWNCYSFLRLFSPPDCNTSEFLSMITVLTCLPLPQALLSLLLGLLLWRLAVSREDAAWFGMPPEAIRRKPTGIAGGVLLLGFTACKLIQSLGYGLEPLVAALGRENTDAAPLLHLLVPLLNLPLLALVCAALYRWCKKLPGAALLGCLSCGLVLLYLLAVTGFSLIDVFGETARQDDGIMQVFYSLKYLCPELFILVLGLLYFVRRWKGAAQEPGPDRAAPSATTDHAPGHVPETNRENAKEAKPQETPFTRRPLPVPAQAFMAVCGLCLAAQILPRIITAVVGLFKIQDLKAALSLLFGGLPYSVIDISVSLPALDYLAAYILLPILCLRASAARRPGRTRLYCLIALWNVCLFSGSCTELVGTFSGYGYQNLLGSMLSLENTYPLIGGLAFIWYLHRSKEAREWLDETMPEPGRAHGHSPAFQSSGRVDAFDGTGGTDYFRQE